MGKTTQTAAVMLLFGLTSSLALADDTESYDPQVDFAKYKTYAWVTKDPMLQATEPGMRLPEPEVLEMIRATIDRQLTAKGFQKAEPADFAVGYVVGVRDKSRVLRWRDYTPNLPGRMNYPWYGSYPARTRTSTQQYVKGVLSVDIFDAKSKRAVWHNWTSTKVYESEEITTQAVVDEVVTEILADFPPAQAK
ncbi:MAG: DUF4136 domain-containing protein [Alphaproteobacteria bacterium]|nr:DUF4136 domain-containing protein [Alphaproteobacteria bacterium]